MSTPKIQQPGFLIDLDGLLINSEELSRVAFERLCTDLSCSFSSDYHASIRGKRKEQWARDFVADFHLMVTAEEVAKRHTKILINELNMSARLMPGAEELLHWIQKKGYPSALVTSSDLNYAQTYTKMLGISGYLNCMVTAEDVSRGKPDPEPFLIGAQRIDRDPTQCLVFEDSINGVLAGKASGALVIAVPSTKSDHEQMIGADYVIPSLVDAFQILTKMGL